MDKITHIEVDEDSGMEMTQTILTEITGIETLMVKVILTGVENGIIITGVKDTVIVEEGEDGIPTSNITIQGINRNPSFLIQIIIIPHRWDINTGTQSRMSNTHIPRNHNNINHQGQLHHKLQIFVSCAIVKATMTINVNLQAILWPAHKKPSIMMDEYKFVNPSAPPASVKAFTLPPAYPNQIQFQPPTLPQDWGDKGAEGKQKLAAQMTAWITTILIIITLLAILYTIFKKCRYVSSSPRVCFPLYPFSTILRGTARTDIFVEVVNLASAEAMWAHFASVAVHPSQLRITGYPRAYDMHIIKLCCCRQLQIDWQNIVLCNLDPVIPKIKSGARYYTIYSNTCTIVSILLFITYIYYILYTISEKDDKM